MNVELSQALQGANLIKPKPMNAKVHWFWFYEWKLYRFWTYECRTWLILNPEYRPWLIVDLSASSWIYLEPMRIELMKSWVCENPTWSISSLWKPNLIYFGPMNVKLDGCCAHEHRTLGLWLSNSTYVDPWSRIVLFRNAVVAFGRELYIPSTNARAAYTQRALTWHMVIVHAQSRR